MATHHTPFGLRQILLLDSAACLGMGALLALLAGPLGTFTGLPVPLLSWAGLILLPIALYMAAVALWLTAREAAVWLVILGNLLWVATSLAVLGLLAPNALGVAFILGQAAIVVVLAWLEYRAARAAFARRQAV